MLQPRILVGSHRTDPQTTEFKILKLKNSVTTSKVDSVDHENGVQTVCTDDATSFTTITPSTPTKMWSHNERFKCMRATSNIAAVAEQDDNHPIGATQRRRRHNNHKSAVWSPALNITSSIYNLATFLILVITLYSTTLCMAQLSGKYFSLSQSLL